MHTTLSTISAALDDLADSILKAYGDNRTMLETWGWSFPPLTRHDLANLATNLSNKIKENNIDDISEELNEELIEIPGRIKLFKGNTIQYLFNGHGQNAVPCYISLIEWISSTLAPLYSWQMLQDNKALPSQLARRLRAIQAELTELIPEKETMLSQIELIQKATEAAETLPTDLQSLKEARNKVSKLSTDSAELFGKIDVYYKDIDSLSKKILEKKDEAEKLVAQCEEAYKITTTKGLAAAFDQRANRLSYSMWVWVCGLLVALLSGIYIGTERFTILNTALTDRQSIGHIWTQIFLSFLSLSPSIWFAWIATKQISQRFKLAEDYAYKASVAKAYEGYRKEAARIDENLEARLFSSALTRLEEAPLRLMENEHHGSPWHELSNSLQIQKILHAIPGLKQKLLQEAKEVEMKDEELSKNKA